MSFLTRHLLIPAALLLCLGCTRTESMNSLTDRVFTLAQTQLPLLSESLSDTNTPRSLDKDGNLVTADIGW